MQIDLDHEEAETILKALETWEKDAHSSAMMSTLVSAMFIKDEQLAKQKAEVAMDRADAESRMRKVSSITIQAKLLKAMAMPKAAIPA